jgi:undecaprenyl diphosphate synthase
MLGAELDTAGVPDPELLIRTSGELRLSNFLLWQAAYTEFVFLDAYWPDFGRELLVEALGKFSRRSRRFGGLSHRSSA